MVLMPAGLAVVLSHNVWVLNWPLIITLLGWIAVISGALRIFAPDRAIKIGKKAIMRREYTTAAAAFWLVSAPCSVTSDFVQECNVMNKSVTGADLVIPKVTTGPLPASRKIYVTPDAAPDLRVPIREIALDASSGEPPLSVYDTTGPYTDPNVTIDVEKGLARNRIAWVKERGGIEEYEGRPIKPVDNGNVTGKHLARNFPSTPKPWRADWTDKPVTHSNGPRPASSPRR